MAVLRTADRVRRWVTDTLAPHGITAQQYNVLRILRGAGRKGLPTLTIADRMVERAPGITRLVDRLEGRGWVRREQCPEDRRRTWCTITAEGLGLLAELDPVVDAADHSGISGLGDDEMDALLDALAGIRAGLSDPPSP